MTGFPPHQIKYFKKAKKMALEFMTAVFPNLKKENIKSLSVCINTDPTVMIIGKKIVGGKNQFGMNNFLPSDGKDLDLENLTVMAAVSYRPAEVLPGPAFITWLGVSSDNSLYPFGTWRQQGFGTFLIIFIIKQICVHDDSETNVVDVPLYLQADTLLSRTFFSSVGFETIGDPTRDEYDLLPMPLKGFADMQIWKVLPRTKHGTMEAKDLPRLLFLPSNSLRKPRYTGTLEVDMLIIYGPIYEICSFC